MESKKSVFETLSEIDVNEFKKGKNGHQFLSWSHAVNELLKVYPESTWSIREWDNLPYLKTEAGCFVQVDVTVEGTTRGQLHPVLDYRNKPILKPDAFQINTSIMRALAKAISLHGMGLYIYQGEDLPPNLIDGLRDEMRSLLGEKAGEMEKFIMRMTVKDLETKIDEYKAKKES